MGLVIAGDIKIKLVDIELLTIQIRLMIASVEKAKELGMDWWTTNKDFNSKFNTAQNPDELEALKKHIEILESKEQTFKTTETLRRHKILLIRVQYGRQIVYRVRASVTPTHYQ